MRHHKECQRGEARQRRVSQMTFDEILGQIIDLLQRQGRVSYGALKRRYALDDAYLEDLKDEILHAQRLAVDEDDRLAQGGLREHLAQGGLGAPTLGQVGCVHHEQRPIDVGRQRLGQQGLARTGRACEQ